MFKELTKTDIVGVIGSTVLTALATALLNVVAIKSNKEEIRETVRRELAEENEVEPQ